MSLSKDVRRRLSLNWKREDFVDYDKGTLMVVSPLPDSAPVAVGVALTAQIEDNDVVAVANCGEGATATGTWHESINMAGVHNLPIIFTVQNNQFAYSSPNETEFGTPNVADRGLGYGIESVIIDGNNILEVYTKIAELKTSLAETPRPVLLEFKTFRMRGHEEASGTKYVPNELLQSWDLKDPLLNYVAYLKTQGILTEEIEVASKASIVKEIQDGLDIAFAEPTIESTTTNELNDVFHQFEYKEIKENNKFNNLRLVDAISESLRQSMQRHDNLVLMGQDIADYGGVFKITDGFLEEFGKDRVRNTPICESAIVEAAMGLSIAGIKSVVEMQFADFVSSGFNPIVNYLAKSYYRWNQNADVVIRMPCGGGLSAGPFHSQTNEAWFTKTPGLKVVYPAFPYDAKGDQTGFAHRFRRTLQSRH